MTIRAFITDIFMFGICSSLIVFTCNITNKLINHLVWRRYKFWTQLTTIMSHQFGSSDYLCAGCPPGLEAACWLSQEKWLESAHIVIPPPDWPRRAVTKWDWRRVPTTFGTETCVVMMLSDLKQWGVIKRSGMMVGMGLTVIAISNITVTLMLLCNNVNMHYYCLG